VLGTGELYLDSLMKARGVLPAVCRPEPARCAACARLLAQCSSAAGL